MATASTLTPSSSTAGTPLAPPARHRSPSPAASALRATAVNNAAAAARCPPNDPNLRTPVSSTYPSSLHSPRPGPATPILKGPTDPEKTPLTPPSAYLDFLRVLSPNPYTHSPLSTGTSTHFSYSASSPRWPSSAALSAKSLSPGPRAFPISRSFGDSRPAASPRPSSAVSSAAMSAAVGASPQRETVSAPPATSTRSAPRANSSRSLTRPRDLKFVSGRLPPNNLQSVPSPTGVPRPQSARLGPPPKRPSLVIPPSPSSSVTSMSPSQHSAPARSAYPSSAHPSSAHPDKLEKLGEPSSAVSARGRSPLSACVQSATEGSTSSPVTVRHIVTRTVTYRRPAGGSAASANTNSSASVAPAPSPARRHHRTRLQSPLSAVEAVSDDDEQDDGKQDQHRLIGDVPKGKRRKVE